MNGEREHAEKLRRDGNELFKQGKWEKAVALYEEGVRVVDEMVLRPADDVKCMCLCNMAAALIKLERWEDACGACDRALKLEEKNIKALLRRAQAGLKLGGRNQVEEDIDEVLKIEPGNKDALGIKAELRKITKERNKASDLQQKKIFGGFWSKEANAVKGSLYEDVVSEEAEEKRQNSVCFFEFSIQGGEKGTVHFELFNKKAPKTCENFRCEKGLDRNGVKLHYEGTIIHRIVKGFAVQGGDCVHRDSERVGEGIASIYGGTMKDENLEGRHLNPGQLCLANQGPNSGGCQFYITMDEAPWLDGDHVIFGQVISGWRILRLIEALDVEDEEDHRPRAKVTVTRSGVCTSEQRVWVKSSENKDARADPGPLYGQSD